MHTTKPDEFAQTKTELAHRLGISRTTLYAYMRRGLLSEDGPWNIEDCLEQLDAVQDEADDDLRGEKLRLECERLRVVIKRESENLKQAQFETGKLQETLVDRKELEGEFRQCLAEIRRACDNWMHHQTAKHPQHVELAESLRATLFDQIITHTKEQIQ